MTSSTMQIVAEDAFATVMAEYTDVRRRATSYQSEAQLEESFIQQLVELGYERKTLHTAEEMVNNLRVQLENLNEVHLSDSEWDTLLRNTLARAQDGIEAKTALLQDGTTQQEIRRDDGSTLNLLLIDKANIHHNHLQVINQYEESGGRHQTRYDVTILVNGLPLVHIELKRRGVNIREAFNQIDRYQEDSFWAGLGLYEYVQLFVISNGSSTKYYSNTTRFSHVENGIRRRVVSKRSSASFEFTSYWTDARNHRMEDLTDFTATFFDKRVLLAVLTRYCVFDASDPRQLLVMRPYQIAATEAVLNRVLIAHNHKSYGKVEAGGYIWHTTGSGKTLTSFKCAQLVSKLTTDTGAPMIDKVLFVVDRKDLDYQTMKEYDRFEKGAVSANKNTKKLEEALEDPARRILVTTIQKLTVFIKSHPRHAVYDREVVLIFDECHRSQFGDMHEAIVRSFKRYYLFGFTGTPIMAPNAHRGVAKKGGGASIGHTTEDLFGRRLHTYTIVDAIGDGNVLPFKIDYIRTVREKEAIDDEQISAIDVERIYNHPDRIREVVSYVLHNFDRKTRRSEGYDLKGRRVRGFNAMMCVDSIAQLKLYYLEFEKQLAALPPEKRLRIAAIFSYAPNESRAGEQNTMGFTADEELDCSGLDQSSRDFLDRVIDKYNSYFSSKFSTVGGSFENYYKDLSRKVKEKQVDLLLVVDMFLTGFDAPPLNTLWVDKNLRMHGLIQAFSRTNRILNSVKTFGNIICFRPLKKRTDEAIALFGDRDAKSTIIMRTFDEYLNGYTDEAGTRHPGYRELLAILLATYPLEEEIVGEQAQREFLRLFGAILKLRNVLSAFDEFTAEFANGLMAPRLVQDYQSRYISIYELLRRLEPQKEDVTDDLVFEAELLRQDEINIDYILLQAKKRHEDNCTDEELKVEINSLVDASLDLRSKKELIAAFISRLCDVGWDEEQCGSWQAFAREQRGLKLQEIISEEKLKPDPTINFMERCLNSDFFDDTGTNVDDLMPPVSHFGTGRATLKERIIQKLRAFFDMFRGT